MPSYNQEQKEQVYKLLEKWGNKKVLEEDISHLTKEEFQLYYK
jgi:hypothetical protein